MADRGLLQARRIALILPLFLMAGALGSQHLGGLYPCEMCYWQRWPHEIAISLAIFAYVFSKQSVQFWLVALAGIAILMSGAIGVFHAGVEYGWWEGLTQCSRPPSSSDSGDFMADIMKTPLVRCDEAQWTLFGVSLAGFNALFSIAGAIAIFGQLFRKRSA